MQAYKKEVIIESGLPYDRLQNLGDATRFTRDDYRYFAEPLWLPPGASIDDNRLDRTWLRPAEQLDPRESRGLVGEHEFVDITQSAMANRGVGQSSDQFKLSDSEDSEDSEEGSDSDYDEQNLGGLASNFPVEPVTPAVEQMQGQGERRAQRGGSAMFSVTSTSEDENGAEDSGWESDSVSSMEYGPVTEDPTAQNTQPMAVFHLSDSSDGEEKVGADSDSDLEFDAAMSSDKARRRGVQNMANDGGGFMLSSTDLSDSDEEMEFDAGDVRQAEGTFNVSDSESSD